MAIHTKRARSSFAGVLLGIGATVVLVAACSEAPGDGATQGGPQRSTPDGEDAGLPLTDASLPFVDAEPLADVAPAPVVDAEPCGLGTSLCAGRCVDTMLDPKHCGACGQVCPLGELCSNGQCGLSCFGGTTRCRGRCVDTLSDPANCGGCSNGDATANTCARGQVCTAGSCRATCGGATPDLCGTGAAARCVSFTTDVRNCGGCDVVCPQGAICRGGGDAASACVCPAGTTACGSGTQRRCVSAILCRTQELYKSCADLHASAPSLTSGAFTIDPDGVGPIVPFDVFCEMESDGGGWTLALKADGALPPDGGTGVRFNYASEVWTTADPASAAYVFSSEMTDLRPVSAKFSSFNTMPVREMRIGMRDGTGAAPRYLAFALPTTQSSLRAMFQGQTIPLATPSRAEWMGLFTTPHLQPLCNRTGINTSSHYLRTRIGIIGNNEDDCLSPDSYIGIGNEGLADFGDSPVGNAAAHNETGPGGNGHIYGFGYVFLR